MPQRHLLVGKRTSMNLPDALLERARAHVEATGRGIAGISFRMHTEPRPQSRMAPRIATADRGFARFPELRRFDPLDGRTA